MNIDKIPAGENLPEEINVIIEISAGGQPIKYEIEKESGAIFVDRFVQTPMFYPANYGFVPHTLSDDGDPCDVLVISDLPIIPGAVIACRPIGAILMEDESGMDEKIVAVPKTKLHPKYGEINSYKDLPETQRNQLVHFFEHYKDLEAGKWVKIKGWADAAEAKDLLVQGLEAAKK